MQRRSHSQESVAALLLVAALALVAVATAWYGRAAVPGAGEPGVRVVTLTGVAANGVWTADAVHGLNYWWKDFEPATVHLRLGDEVVLNLKSADLFHRFYLPAFRVGPVDVEPGHMATVRFRADRPGVFQYYCSTMCGSCHFYMRGWIVVTAPGEEPVEPPPILCTLCRPGEEPPPPPEDAGLVARGSHLYLLRGCLTCHGPDGHGGVANPNSTTGRAPAHDTTAQKLFLNTPEDVQSFLDLVASGADPEGLEETPDIPAFPVVRARWADARQIIRGGRYSAKLDPEGPEPPLQMPAWQYLLDEREIDALLSYFVSLRPWEGEEGTA